MSTSTDELAQVLRELRKKDDGKYAAFESGMLAALGSVGAAVKAIEDVLASVRAES